MKLVKYFLQKKAVTILLLVLILAGGLFSYIKMGKLEDAPFTKTAWATVTNKSLLRPQNLVGKFYEPGFINVNFRIYRRLKGSVIRIKK